jgi:histidinol-phosphate aminotransferase
VIRPREAVRKMAAYSPPTGGRAEKLRLDFNENTSGCSPRVIEALQRWATADRLTIYPEYSAAMETLAAFFDVSRDEFTMTNGTDEAIQVFVNAFVDRGDDVLLLTPSYAMYRFYAQVADASIRELPYRAADLSFPLEELLAAIRPETRTILIANPNNPTGTQIDVRSIRMILNAAPQAAVLIDEAYVEFSGVTVLPQIREYPNLFVSRTFSKAYGMAAMRCGCLFSSAENMQWIRKSQSPYSVNAMAAVAARAAVEDQDFVASYVSEVAAARELVCGGLERMGIRYFPSSANFVLFDAGDRAREICTTLRERGVLVRDRSYEIPGCVRVTIGTREQAARFLDELKELVA